MIEASALIAQAKEDSKTKPVILVLFAHDCPQSRVFQTRFKKVMPAFEGALECVVAAGSHQNRDANPEALKQALAALAYDKTPNDSGGNQRGHFPSGAIYVNGKEVARLPSDNQLEVMGESTLAQLIQEHTGATYDLRTLSRSVDDLPRSI